MRLFLGDESTKVILTPEGNADDVSTELSDFLNYLAGKGGSSSFVKRLNAAVDKARNKIGSLVCNLLNTRNVKSLSVSKSNHLFP